MAKELSGATIYNMNCGYPWSGCIKVPDKNKTTFDLREDNKKYVLHATGDCDITNGRTYVALPANMKITDEVRRKHNLI